MVLARYMSSGNRVMASSNTIFGVFGIGTSCTSVSVTLLMMELSSAGDRSSMEESGRMGWGEQGVGVACFNVVGEAGLKGGVVG